MLSVFGLEAFSAIENWEASMKLRQGDAVLIRAKIVSVDANQATVSLSSTDFAIVPLGAIIEPAASIVREKAKP